MLKDYSVVVERALEWGDMDAFQHVNNIIYFRFFNRIIFMIPIVVLLLYYYNLLRQLSFFQRKQMNLL